MCSRVRWGVQDFIRGAEPRAKLPSLEGACVYHRYACKTTPFLFRLCGGPCRFRSQPEQTPGRGGSIPARARRARCTPGNSAHTRRSVPVQWHGWRHPNRTRPNDGKIFFQCLGKYLQAGSQLGVFYFRLVSPGCVLFCRPVTFGCVLFADLGASVNLENEDGHTALMEAAQHGADACVQVGWVGLGLG